MWDSVDSVWIPFNKPLEGYLDFMYLDSRNLVTTGMGNLIDPRGVAEALPWYDKNTGEYSSIDEIDAAWGTVKSRTDLSPLGGGAFRNVTSLRLTEVAIDDLIRFKLSEMEGYLERRPPFGGFQTWPADAQLGLLSMAWGMGPAFNFPNFQTYASVRNWTEAAKECRFNPNVGTIKIRNDRNQQLFRNAALVEELGLDPSELLWPNRTAPLRGYEPFVCQLASDPTIEGSFRVSAEFDVDMQFPVRPAGFTQGYGGPNAGGHRPPEWYMQYGMDLGGDAGTAVYAAFDGVVKSYYRPAVDADKVYGAQIFIRYPDYDHAKMGAFYTHLTDVPESVRRPRASVSRGDFLGNVMQSPSPLVPPHLHLALVEIIGGLPDGRYQGVDLYSLFLDLETIYSENYVTVRFMQDGRPPEVQWERMQVGSYAAEPSKKPAKEHQP